ncbi:MAG: hypothetical protein JWL88_545 [Parcubacteria group bacterium]|nr:hypothetical protein [Parcubacteria group bacterium]
MVAILVSFHKEIPNTRRQEVVIELRCKKVENFSWEDPAISIVLPRGGRVSTYVRRFNAATEIESVQTNDVVWRTP